MASRLSPCCTFAKHSLLALLIVMLAGRVEASCFSATPDPVAQSQMMANCADMGADVIDQEQPSPIPHSSKGQAEMCHLGCPVLLVVAEAQGSYPVLLPSTYVAELTPLLLGIADIPQTPPPRFG